MMRDGQYESNHSLDCRAASAYKLVFDHRHQERLVNFYPPEESEGHVFRWSEPVAMVRLDVPPQRYRLVIDTASLRGSQCRFDFRLFWNQHRVCPTVIRADNGLIQFDVTPSMFVPHHEQRLTISCKPLVVENGRRHLGMPVASIELIQDSDNSMEESVTRRHNPLTTRARSLARHLLGKKPPAPRLPLWQVKLPGIGTLTPSHAVPTAELPRCDMVVASSVEINSRHGTGLLVQYLFEDFSQIATISSRSCYQGDRVASQVHHQLPEGTLQRHEVYDAVLGWFRHYPPRQAYVVPFFESDLLVALALKDMFDAQVCLHIMDDNNLYGDISDGLMAETLSKVDLRLAISSEMRRAYEERYGQKFWMLPPIVPDNLIWRELRQLPTGTWRSSSHRSWYRRLTSRWRKSRAGQCAADRSRGVLIGNVWDEAWLQMLRRTVRQSGCQLDWYCNNPDAVWLNDSTANLSRDGIFVQPALWGQQLVDELRQRPFAVMPTARLSGDEPQGRIARLSLPSRIPFAIATAQLPIVVLGNSQTTAGQFVKRFELGETVDYDGPAFRRAIARLLRSHVQRTIRSRAREIAPGFSSIGVRRWLQQSLTAGMPSDQRFEKLFGLQQGDFAFFVDVAPPKQVHWASHGVWQILRRLKLQGFQPDTVIDVGASNGIWSATAARVFPEAHFVLIDPLLSRYNQEHRQIYLQGLQNPELLEVALSDRDGQSEILISHDLFGSSLLKVNENIRKAEVATVDVVTLDQLARRRGWSGKTLLKIDVQFAEHLVIAGGLDFLRSNVEALILELSLEREHPQAKTYREMLDMMSELGFNLVDETEGWRSPRDGRLEQKDVVFTRSRNATAARAA